VPLAQRAQLLERESTAAWWQQRASSAFLKQGCKVSLLEALQGDGHFELVGEDGAWSASLACTYCTGEDPSETSQFMIGCDTCGQWYHGPCVGVGKAAADALDDFICPACASRQQKEYSFGPPLPLPKRTRRPTMCVVKALLREADELAIRIPESTVLSGILEQAEQWQVRARQHLHDIDGERVSFADSVAIVREAEALEVVPDLLLPLQQHVQRYREWSEAVDELRSAPQEQKRGAALATASWDGLEGAFGLQTQAGLLRVPAEDMAKLISALSAGPGWQSAVRAALPASGQTDIAELQSLLSTADVHVSPECEQLKLALARRELMPVLDDGEPDRMDVTVAAGALTLSLEGTGAS